MDLKEIALRITQESGAGGMDRVMRIVAWLNGEFQWTATDYQDRTVEAILERRAGNCAEQARVLNALLSALDIPTRWIAEINLQPKDPQRQASAEEMVGKTGVSASVFGLMHNDHRWLEVHDEQKGAWVPADPTLNLFGVDLWVRGRLGFEGRPEAGKDMLIPFAVLVMEPGLPVENRSGHYLVDEFSRVYPQVEVSPSWPGWVALTRELSALVEKAFRGEACLFDHLAQMEQLLSTYEALSADAARGVQ